MAMTKKEKDYVEGLERVNAQLNAECNALTIKLKNQIRRGNILSGRAKEHGVPESPTMMVELRRAWGMEHPGVRLPADDVIKAWAVEHREVPA